MTKILILSFATRHRRALERSYQEKIQRSDTTTVATSNSATSEPMNDSQVQGWTRGSSSPEEQPVSASALTELDKVLREISTMKVIPPEILEAMANLYFYGDVTAPVQSSGRSSESPKLPLSPIGVNTEIATAGNDTSSS